MSLREVVGTPKGRLIGAGVVLLAFFVSIGLVARVSAHGGDAALTHGCVTGIFGFLRIISPGGSCLSGERPLDWYGFSQLNYRSAQGVGFARAFCLPGEKLTGGGGFVETPPGGGIKEEKLRQTHPISDETGVIAFGTTAIGWQAASSDFTDTVVAFAICASR